MMVDDMAKKGDGKESLEDLLPLLFEYENQAWSIAFDDATVAEDMRTEWKTSAVVEPKEILWAYLLLSYYVLQGSEGGPVFLTPLHLLGTYDMVLSVNIP